MVRRDAAGTGSSKGKHIPRGGGALYFLPGLAARGDSGALQKQSAGVWTSELPDRDKESICAARERLLVAASVNGRENAEDSPRIV